MFCALLVGGLGASPVAAQIEGVLSGEANRPILVKAPAEDDNRQPLTLQAPVHPWATDLLIGMPTGVRVKRFFNDEAGQGWMGEGFVGVEIILPIVGGGVRYGFAPHMSRNNVISISPGLDAYILPNIYQEDWDGVFFGGGPSAFGLISLDVDVSWRHIFSDSISGEVGFKIGAAAGINTAAPIIPVVSWFFGLCF